MGNADSKQPGAGSPQKGSAQAGHIGTFEGNEVRLFLWCYKNIACITHTRSM